MVKLVVKPIADVLSEDEIRRKTDEYVSEMLRNAQVIGDDLFLVDKATGKATPSFFSNDCFVKSLIKLRFGTITNMEGIRSLARGGRAIHDLYQEWFKFANPRVHVEIESGIETVDTSGRADIVYMREFDGEEVWGGLIELKSSWNLNEDRERRYLKQVISYVLMLEETGITIREAYLVTMRDVKSLPINRLRREYQNVIMELKAIENYQGWPMEPPDPLLCVRCELKPICNTYAIYRGGNKSMMSISSADD
ncbi:Dna2/Cas4 domain-containing protein [Vulcanisaeta distributa]|uniref:CRISPR-associated protein Cas4 n=1 Tax=Vulcanisaeta distributa TaxID=164451 RepID=UPI0006CF9264|nr:Dna2/Cas4 domain-containing protein [Vulcanisaeta distributa]